MTSRRVPNPIDLLFRPQVRDIRSATRDRSSRSYAAQQFGHREDERTLQMKPSFQCLRPAFQTISRELQSSELRQLHGRLELFLRRSRTAAVEELSDPAGYVKEYAQGCLPGRDYCVD